MDFDELPRLGDARATNGFLQVLLPRLELRRRSTGGLHLTIELRDDLPAITRSADKQLVAARLDADEGREMEARLADFLAGRGEDHLTLAFDRFALRHASAGVLPRLAGAERRWLLFHRDIPPVGWNIANGASASRAELADVERLMRREAAEELLFLTADDRLLTLAPPEDHEELARAVTLWQQRLGRSLTPAVARATWIDGPDALEVRAPDGPATTTDGLFLGLHAEDFGIECVRLLDVDAPPDATPLDGELLAGRLLDRPVRSFDPASPPSPLCPVTDRLARRLRP